MAKPGWIILAAILLFAFTLPVAAKPLLLQGEAQRGDTVVHSFEHDGKNLEFRLIPIGQGWSIWVGDPSNRERNQVIVATPPYRGINSAVIQGWHFRNADNTGPNNPGEGNVNAPGKIRKFAFVLDGAGYQAAQEALEILMWPENRSQAEVEEAENRLKAVPTAQAVLEIEALELGNLAQGEQAWIERMAFRMEINIP